jgi:hypothetical protein
MGGESVGTLPSSTDIDFEVQPVLRCFQNAGSFGCWGTSPTTLPTHIISYSPFSRSFCAQGVLDWPVPGSQKLVWQAKFSKRPLCILSTGQAPLLW